MRAQTVNQVGSAIVVKYNDAVEISFDLSVHLFTVEINPFLFASTGGLLGVFDNEPEFDFVAPSGEILSEVTKFAKSWEVRGADD